MKLLLDLGNTRLKWAFAHDGAWRARGAVAWQDDVAGTLISAWRELVRPEQVLASSVVDAEREASLTTLVADRFGADISWARTPAEACGVRNAYAQPQRLGIDRFLAMVAAHDTGHVPYVLAGIGTALTLDALTADGRHLGGLIAPGPYLMQQAILGATARVQTDHPGTLRNAADNTADAVVSGCWQATAALIDRFTTRMTPELGGPAQLLIDGGDASTVLPLLDHPAQHAPDSVLRGLLVWARQSATGAAADE